MKQRFTQAKKANRFNQRINGKHSIPVFWRRVRGIYGADHHEFDRKHPSLEAAVWGMRKRIGNPA